MVEVNNAMRFIVRENKCMRIFIGHFDMQDGVRIVRMLCCSMDDLSKDEAGGKSVSGGRRSRNRECGDGREELCT